MTDQPERPLNDLPSRESVKYDSTDQEVRLFVTFWAEIQTEMNKILAQEGD